MTEILLIRRAVRGDRASLERLIRLYYEKIYNYICFQTRDPNIAEDLTQDVFLKLVRNIHSYVPTASFSSYLYKIAHNTIIDYFRTARPTEEIHENQIVSDSLAAVEAKITVQGLLTRLSEEQRECMILYYMQELTYREIAQILDIPIPTAKSRVQRGLTACKKMMEEKI
ncbi:MAG: RNA polymerase sigma factor [Lachnospiraceae bacterium]|nr:RNA polymerase sigma factor [Lachnospiraceae bacterium]